MADIYRANIARVELDGDLVREHIGSLLATGDKLANRFGVEVYRGGENVSIADKSLIGYFIRPEADTVVISGVTSGNSGYVELPQSCYTQEGAFTLALKLSGGGVVQTVRVMDGKVILTQEGDLIDPGTTVPTLDDLLAQIDACEAATEAAVEAVEAVDTLDTKANQFGMLGGNYTLTVGAEEIVIDATGSIMRVLAGNTWHTVTADTYTLTQPSGINHGIIVFEDGAFTVEGGAAFTQSKTKDKVAVGIVYWDTNGKITKYEINGEVSDQRSPAYGGEVVRDVRLFGAMGDGVTDDTDAIQDALDACTNGILYFPNGTYLFRKTLNIHSNTHIMGNKGYTRIKLKPQQANELDELEWRPADNRSKYPAVRTDADSTGVIVEGIIFEGDTTYFHDLQQNGLYITGSHHVIQDCQFINWNYFPDEWVGRQENASAWGLAICHANHIKIEDCHFNQNGYEGAGTEFSYQVDFRGCYFGKAMRTALQIHRSSARISLEGCVLNNSVDTDNPLGDFATMTFHGANGALIDGVKIVNCDFRHRHIQCVDGYERNVQISNCRIYSDSNRFVAITMGGAANPPQDEGWQIVGNEFFSIKDDGQTTIDMNVNNCVVSDNIIHTNATTPIVLNGANNMAADNLIIRIVSSGTPESFVFPAPYALPTASATVKGGVKVGSGLQMDGEVLKAKIDQTLLVQGAAADAAKTGELAAELGMGTSKNLNTLPYQTSTQSGVTFTANDDNSITISGTASDNVWVIPSLAASTSMRFMLPAGTYTLSGTKAGVARCYVCIYRESAPTTLVQSYSDSGSGVTFATAEDFLAAVQVVVAAGATVDGETVYPQLESGSFATKYASPFTNESKRLDGIETEIAILQDAVGSPTVPAYYFDDNYLSGRVAAIKAKMLECAGHGDAFIFITDAHWTQNAGKSPALINYIASKVNINKVICGGDMGDSNTYIEVNALLRKYFQGRVFCTMGNHEYFYPNTGSILEYNCNMYNEDVHTDNAERNYYYYDNDRAKVRYVMLSAFAPALETAISQGAQPGHETAQIEWLTDKALNVDDGWTIIVCTHMIHYMNLTTLALTPPTTGGQAVLDALDAYNADSNSKGKVACVIQGHTHYDRVTHTTGGIPIVIVGCDKYMPWMSGETNNEPWLATRIAGTITEQAFDVVVMDKQAEELHFFRIGGAAFDGVDNDPGEPVDIRTVSYALT